MPDPHSHLFHVTIAVTGIAADRLELSLPGWTPGSYMIREYARHVQEFAASAGAHALAWRKISKDSWQIETGGAEQVLITYRVYAFELTVRTSHLDGSHGYFNGAGTFMFVHDGTAEPLGLRIEPVSGWHISTGLEAWPDDGPHSFLAADYDELVDAPVECGTHRRLHFTVDDIPHEIAIWGRGNEDEQRLLDDTRRIVEIQRDFFGGLPYEHYTFILHLTDGRGGGLEHRNSVSNMLDRWTFRPEQRYERYLALTSHELFHVWNVKRLRPAPLGPFDYCRENYTRQLWVAEGITSYYDELLLVRAGLLSANRFLEKLANEIMTLQRQPGRRVQSLEQSSFDAWIKFYRPDENSDNSSISYYLKGSLVSLLLDMQIRRESGGECSLDDVLRHLYERYPLSGPGIPEDGGILDALEHVTGMREPFEAFYRQYIAGTAELDYATALDCVGVEMEWVHQRAGSGAAPAWLGLTTRSEAGRLLVAKVHADGPAYPAGVYAGDQLLALDGWRIDAEKLNERLAERAPGDTVRLALFRYDQLIEVPIYLTASPPDQLRLHPIAEPDAFQQRMYQDWLGHALKD
jgi:predicted metalloprotease with PDZ domain